MKRYFTKADSVVDLIDADFNILPILSRFSIPLGFGNKTIEEVCHEAHINTDIFLMVVNYLLSGHLPTPDYENSPEIARGIVDFLHKSHDYFMAYKFPHIRANLLEALDAGHSDINPAIVSFFDNYIAEVKRHFSNEEKHVFPYVRAIAAGKNPTDYSIDKFRRHHDEVALKLSELKNIIMRYYTTAVPDKMYDVLVDIYNCETDLESHAEIENHLLIPLAMAIERNLNERKS